MEEMSKKTEAQDVQSLQEKCMIQQIPEVPESHQLQVMS
jgi:hypothetical protein